MSDWQDPEQNDADAGEASPEPATVPPFQPSALRRQLRVDRLLRWLVGLAAAALLLSVVSMAPQSPLALGAALAIALAAWMLLNGLSARVSTQLGAISDAIERDTEAAESHLAEALKRKPLMRWVRLMLYHRLALLRHQQKRYDESAWISETLLGYHLGPAENARSHLLLLSAEARLHMRDAHGAHPAIAALHEATLPLTESLQRLALQTRYELLTGYPDRALWQYGRKIDQAELMPAPHCGSLHAMLATAAEQQNQPRLAHWLRQRVELLCSEEQRHQLERDGSGETVVQTPPPDPVSEIT